MNKLKYFIITIGVMFVTLPAFSIEDTIMLQEQSSNFSELGDYTGDNFFQSYYELEENRDKEKLKLYEKYERSFKTQYDTEFDAWTARKSKPPLKILREKILATKDAIKEKITNKKVKKQEYVSVDANGTPIEESVEEENEVLAEEENLVQTIVRCKVTKYLPETGEIEGYGGIHITFPQDGINMYSDRMTYNTESEIIQLFDNVKIIQQNGDEIFGDYMKVDMNDESGILTKPKMDNSVIQLIAENGYMFGDTMVTENGKIVSTSDGKIEMLASGFGQAVRQLVIPREELNYMINDVNSNKYMIKVNEIRIDCKNSHDTIKLKQPKIYSTKTGRKIFALPSMTLYANKEKDYVEGNYPELGSFGGFGMFAGPGFVFEAPFGSTLKVLPTVNYKNKFGFGGLARFQSGSNRTEFGYSTASNMFLLKGLQRLDDHLFFQYGANSYMNNWFLGSSWVGYGGELLYEKGHEYSDFLYKGADLDFRYRVTAGILRENEKDGSNKKRKGYHKMSTARFRYMAQIDQTLFSLFDDEEEREHYDGWRRVKLSLVGQGSAALYGTGDTQIIGRIGPRLNTQYKNWAQDFGYFLSSAEDNTPMDTLDSYRYGRSCVYLREYWRVSRYLTLGLYTSYNLAGSVYDYQSNKRTRLREATFYVALGPDDFKVNLGYDFIRENTYFGISMAMNTKGTTVDYKKFEIKNPEMFGKTKGPENVLEDNKQFTPPPSPYITKAVVSDVEDATTVIKGEPL